MAPLELEGEKMKIEGKGFSRAWAFSVQSNLASDHGPRILADIYPLITAIGRKRATFLAIPARTTTSTTASTSL